jgi:gliding motility-associated-like protein
VKNFLIYFVLLCSPIFGKATHIVGGDMKYNYLGGRSYEIIITIYRDCNSGTNFDGLGTQGSPAFTLGLIPEGQFFSSNTYNITINSSNITPVYSAIKNPCLDTPTNICVQYATYKTTITVPDANKAYYLVYQRCCRNNSIVNIVPNATVPNITMPGATYMIRIPPTNPYQNTSAVFAKFPPKFICKGVQFTYNHSATDADGDSLSYELYTPFDGLDGSSPTTNSPQFDTSSITWKSPYSLANVMGGIPLAIDQNGVLTCTPNMVGQFVVGVRVNEWRNGVKINSVNRDFQFNVSNCNGPIASVPQKPGTIDAKTGIGFFDINCDSFTVKFINSSSGANKYKWNFGDPASGANNTSTLQAPSHTYSDTGTYNVTLVAINYVNANSDSCSDTFRTKVSIYPNFYVGFTKLGTCEDSLALFTDTSSHRYGTINNWSWTFGDGTSSTLKNPTHKYPDGGRYPVALTATTNRGCLKTVKDTIDIYPEPIPKFSNPTPACVNTPLVFIDSTTIMSGYTIASWKWELGDSLVATTKNANIVYTIPGNKTVRLIVKSNRGCVDTINKPIVINPLPNINAGPDVTICWNASTPLNAAGGVSYRWSPGKTLSDSLIANPIASPKSYPIPQKYFVFGVDNNNCVNKDSIIVSFFPKPPVNAGVDTSVCLNPSPFVFKDSALLNATGAVSYSWTPAQGLNSTIVPNPMAKPKVNTDYVVEGIDINLCKATDTVRVIVLDPSLELLPATDTFLCENDSIYVRVLDQGLITKYVWTPAAFISSSSIRNPLFFPKDTTYYALYVENYCYNKSDTIRLDVRTKPSMDYPRIDSICIDDTYQINVQGTGVFSWRFNPSLSAFNIPNPLASPRITTTYYVTLTDAYNCQNKDSLLLYVYLKPNVQILTRPRFVCQGVPIQLRSYSDPGSTFVWTPVAGLNNPTAQNPILVPSDTTWYIVEATNIHGCKDKDSVRLNVQKPIVPVAPNPVRICENAFVFVEAFGGLYYRWTPGFMINDSLKQQSQIFTDRDTVYKVYISNDCFTDSAIVNVLVDTLVDLQAATDTTIIRGFETTLKVAGSNKVEWTPNYAIDNVFSPTPTVKPLKSTTYYVKNIAENGCISYDSVTVLVKGKTILLLPTGFSPNADGTNDLFGIVKYLNIEKLNRLVVYNRWGEEVYSTTDIDARWDGTFREEKMPVGTYVWSVDVLTYDGENIRQSGNVTLLR